MTLGESIGFLAPVVGFAVGVLGLGFGRDTYWIGVGGRPSFVGTMMVYGSDLGAQYLTMILAGAVEGACLGVAQSAALRRGQVAVSRAGWIVATAVGAAVAWAIGMLPSTLSDLGLPPFGGGPGGSVAVIIATIVGALVLLVAIPALQWVVMRRVVGRAWRWIPLNMAAWLVGLVFPFLPSPFIDFFTPLPVLVVAYAVAGVAMAATVATLTGLGLRRMLRTAR
ncbi:hypothetical protein [Raineyella sp. LH-20]|uniref:hypothetical protein n=1 Tax=Raineyella sp. LH-20 TaxID=3081204 RepID=UPI0029556D08|nr:hypothetical protein [Raineyella sp. LH-20]WOP18167.1 hypothetical protein R0146_13165 [Raineyella sp. LH-20]